MAITYKKASIAQKLSQSTSVHALPYMEGVYYTCSSFPCECRITSSVLEELIFLILRVFSSFLRFVGVVQEWKAVQIAFEALKTVTLRLSYGITGILYPLKMSGTFYFYTTARQVRVSIVFHYGSILLLAG